MKNRTGHDTTPLPDPAKDGIDHINVHYNHSAQPLGRHLSTYYVARFEHPYFGPFKCIEGFKLYVETGCRDDAFRYLTGAQAKSHFRKQMGEGRLKKCDVPNLEQVLMGAYFARLMQHPVTALQFQESTLPFELYFPYPGSGHPVRPEEAGMLTHLLTTLRDLMKTGQPVPTLSNAEYAKLIVR